MQFGIHCIPCPGPAKILEDSLLCERIIPL